MPEAGTVTPFDTGAINVTQLANDTPQKQAAQQTPGQLDEPASKEDTTDWKKRYSDSTREAQRLKAEADKAKVLEAENTRLKAEREKFKPFDDMLVQRPDFAEHVKTYFDGGAQGNQPTQNSPALSPKKYGMDSYADFDLEEAFSNPNSASGRMLKDRDTMIAGSVAAEIVDKRLKGFENVLRQRDEQTAEQRARENFLKQNPGKTQEDLDKMIEWAKDNPLTLDRMAALYNLETNKDDLFEAGQNEVRKQMALSGSMPKTLASKASGDTKKRSEADDFFDSIKSNAALTLGKIVTTR